MRKFQEKNFFSSENKDKNEEIAVMPQMRKFSISESEEEKTDEEEIDEEEKANEEEEK